MAPQQWQRQQGSRKRAEEKLGVEANAIYDSILDLNTPRHELELAWTRIMNLRDQLLGMYGVEVSEGEAADLGAWRQPGMRAPAAAAAAAPAAVAPSAATASDEDSFDYKSRLLELCIARGRCMPTKDILVYKSNKAPEGGWLSSLSSELLTYPYQSPEPSWSKKLAEHTVARLAIMAEFPGALGKGRPPPSKGAGKGEKAAGKGEKGAGKGKDKFAQGAKRKQSETEDLNSNPKSKLCQSVQALLQRTAQQGDIVFEVTRVDEDPHSQYVAALSLPTYDEFQVWDGEAATTMKQAEYNVASVVLEALAEPIAIAFEEQREKRARKQDEKQAEFRARQDAKDQGLFE